MELTGPVSCYGPPVRVTTGSFETLVQPTVAAQMMLVARVSIQHTTPDRPIYTTIYKLFSGKVSPYWAVGFPTTAPVPWLIVKWAVLCTLGD